MGQQVIEGPWHEVLRHADELAGKRVRLTVLDDPPLDEALGGLLEAAEQLARSRVDRGAEPVGSWEEDVAAKFRAQGFDL